MIKLLIFIIVMAIVPFFITHAAAVDTFSQGIETHLCGQFARSHMRVLSEATINEAQCYITVDNTQPNKTTYTIQNPVVNNKSYEYQYIIFSPGDIINVQAGGCVQTGGTGNTWKRYVNPSGNDADHLYFGSIEIPGVLGSKDEPQRLQQVIGKEIIVNTAQSTNLILHYTDDNYSTNG